MRFVFKFAILGVVLLIITHYVFPQSPVNNFVNNGFADAEKVFNHLFKKDTPADRVKVSTWTDAKGVVHYENRSVGGAKTIEVDPNVNVLPSAPAAKLPDVKDEKPKTMNEELRDIQEAKKAHIEAIINH